MFKRIRTVMIATVVGVVPPMALARSTGWVNGFEWIRISKTLAKNGEMPVSVVCKDSNSKGLTNQSGLAKVEIEKNPGNISWIWAFAARAKQLRGKLEKRGYKLVSWSEYRRASGLTIPCAIWHKVN